MTTFSPHTVGRVATRRSTFLPCAATESRPSCGMRRSAMLMSAMIFRREITPDWMARGERITLGQQVFTIGRLPECSIPVNDANVSRRHAEVRPAGSAFALVDLGSTNGTKVNGVRIEGERVLVDGDIVSVGSIHMRFEAS